MLVPQKSGIKYNIGGPYRRGLAKPLCNHKNKPKCVQQNAPWVKCCICRKRIKTCERKRPARNNDYRCPAHPNGAQLTNHKWVCSGGCYMKAVLKYFKSYRRKKTS